MQQAEARYRKAVKLPDWPKDEEVQCEYGYQCFEY